MIPAPDIGMIVPGAVRVATALAAGMRRDG
jgi:hypothetical protein